MVLDGNKRISQSLGYLLVRNVNTVRLAVDLRHLLCSTLARRSVRIIVVIKRGGRGSAGDVQVVFLYVDLKHDIVLYVDRKGTAHDNTRDDTNEHAGKKRVQNKNKNAADSALLFLWAVVRRLLVFLLKPHAKLSYLQSYHILFDGNIIHRFFEYIMNLR